MRTAIFAALLAFGATSAAVAPTQAASITITTDNGWRDDGWRDNGRHYGWDRGKHRGWYKKARREARRDCDVTVRRFWRDGRRVVVRTRDCY